MQHRVRVVMVMIGLHFSLASSLWAFAVGDIAVHSRRGEPFAAEIPLLLESRERDKGVEVTLGNREAYQVEGFKRPAAIDALKAVLFPDTRDVIRLSSAVPLRKSAFDLVLSVRAGQITIVKHYHIALPAPAPASAHVMAPLPTIAQVAPIAEAPQTTVKPTRFAAAAAKRKAATPPAEKTVEKPAPAQAVVLPVAEPGNMVSMAELQTVLQELEERLIRRLTPTAQVQEVKAPTAFVSASELQESIQNLEERLTQRIQQMLTQTPESVRFGQRPTQSASPVAQPPPAVEAAQPASLLLVP